MYNDLQVHRHVHNVCIVLCNILHQLMHTCGCSVQIWISCTCSSLSVMFVWLQYRQVLHNSLTKLFADLEMKKKKLEERDQAERSVFVRVYSDIVTVSRGVSVWWCTWWSIKSTHISHTRWCQWKLQRVPSIWSPTTNILSVCTCVCMYMCICICSGDYVKQLQLAGLGLTCNSLFLDCVCMGQASFSIVLYTCAYILSPALWYTCSYMYFTLSPVVVQFACHKHFNRCTCKHVALSHLNSKCSYNRLQSGKDCQGSARTFASLIQECYITDIAI